jgi:hypothetical protein
MSSNAKPRAGTEPAMDLVPTPVGTAGITWYPARGPVRAMAMLGHGTATGVEAPDLQALAAALPQHGVTVALVTQPYRISRTRSGSDQASLDTAWSALWPIAAGRGVPVISGGRSAGSQVACRTARQLGAHAVLALAYPLLGPGSPQNYSPQASPPSSSRAPATPSAVPRSSRQCHPESNSPRSPPRTTPSRRRVASHHRQR